MNVWQQFSIRTLGEYSDLYLKTDVLLLADICENFRDSYVTSYGLDFAYYYFTAYFTRLYVGGDVETYSHQFRTSYWRWHGSIHRTWYTRGSELFQQICAGNNKCRYTTHRNHRYTWYTMMLITCTVVILITCTICQLLPCADFRWVNDVENFNVMDVALDSPTGYILEMDLKCPQHFHERVPRFARRARNHPISEKISSSLCCMIRSYVIYYRNLQQCTHHGLRITKIHRILQFTQSSWLRKYVELNTNFRTRITNLRKNYYKLMNNAVLSKTMENVA